MPAYDNFDLPDTTKNLLVSELAPGEVLRWVGRPNPKGSWFPGLFAIFPFIFGLFFFGFAVFWTVMAMNGPGGLFAFFGIPFMLAGLGVMSSPFWMRFRMRKAAQKTVYAITDQRAIIFDGGYYGDSGISTVLASAMTMGLRRAGSTSIRSFRPHQLTNISRNQSDDGSGDVLFGQMPVPIVVDSRMNQYQHYQQPMPRDGFYSIPDVKEAELMLQELAKRDDNAGGG